MRPWDRPQTGRWPIPAYTESTYIYMYICTESTISTPPTRSSRNVARVNHILAMNELHCRVWGLVSTSVFRINFCWYAEESKYASVVHTFGARKSSSNGSTLQIHSINTVCIRLFVEILVLWLYFRVVFFTTIKWTGVHFLASIFKTTTQTCTSVCD